ncbi:MAG: phosphoribosylformimino-5-aminoimidazole carboxamide ribotide isomerase [Lachnospiraceae bacterium]|nr:phosphoribosylformimino-5-aminoimidazole carboxamide ribotide isomerase [Lachnospiraceae bacterium]
MEFRPCIDIHNGKVKQIVGGSLRDVKDRAVENFVSDVDAAFYANLYKKHGIKGGHVILLNGADSDYYEATKKQALSALAAYPGGLQIGGGVTAENGAEYIAAGASHVIVTSYVFKDGKIHYGNLERLKKAVGAKRIVLDLSCRKKEEGYVVVTDRWQKETKERVTLELLDRLAESCDEFLIHAVDVEGKARGIEKELVALLGKWGKKTVTYAGGVHDFQDLQELKQLGKGKVNVTIGSALDLFGGKMEFEKVLEYIKNGCF